MAKLSNVPQVVDWDVYAGDTWTFTVTAPDALIAGRPWSGQVRADPESADTLAEFTITEPTEPDGPAFVTLPGETVRALGSGFRGVYDIQVGDTDPVTSLVKGAVVLTWDVTRDA